MALREGLGEGLDGAERKRRKEGDLLCINVSITARVPDDVFGITGPLLLLLIKLGHAITGEPESPRFTAHSQARRLVIPVLPAGTAACS